jgi:hypothetical protein
VDQFFDLEPALKMVLLAKRNILSDKAAANGSAGQ